MGRPRWLAVIGVAAVLLGGCAGGNSGGDSGGGRDAGLVVHTAAGSVRGTADGAVHRFQGVQYGQARRWAPPRDPQPWPGVRDAARPGPRCPQSAGGPGAAPSTDENCLFLNVTTPAKTGAPRPVMVWIHGGDGTGAGGDYDPVRLVNQGNVVVVTVNYRLGAFGNFALPQLPAASTSLGTQDQLAALRWVQRNAAAFGGDPHNVTVFGESFGAFATCALISSPQARGLINRAIMESSSCSAYFTKNAIAPGLGHHTEFVPLQQAQAFGAAAAAKFGCAKDPDVLGCLRKVPVQAWLDGGYTEVFTAMPWGTPTLPRAPATAMRDGRTLPIPVLFGTNRDELRLYTASSMATGLPFDAGTYQHLLADTYGADAKKIAAAYPASAGPFGPALAWAAATTDNGWGCPTIGDARAIADRRRPVYAYQFADEHAPNTQGYPTPQGFPLAAAHGLEVGYLFGAAPGTQAQHQLAHTLVGYWTNFARTGNPNGAGLPHWPGFADGGQFQRLGTDTVGPIDPRAAARCALWDGVPVR